MHDAICWKQTYFIALAAMKAWVCTKNYSMRIPVWITNNSLFPNWIASVLQNHIKKRTNVSYDNP